FGLVADTRPPPPTESRRWSQPRPEAVCRSHPVLCQTSPPVAGSRPLTVYRQEPPRYVAVTTSTRLPATLTQSSPRARYERSRRPSPVAYTFTSSSRRRPSRVGAGCGRLATLLAYPESIGRTFATPRLTPAKVRPLPFSATCHRTAPVAGARPRSVHASMSVQLTSMTRFE